MVLIIAQAYTTKPVMSAPHFQNTGNLCKTMSTIVRYIVP